MKEKAKMIDVLAGGRFTVQCRDKNGKLKWEEVVENIVVDEGLQYILDAMFISATSQIDPFYVGLTDGSPSVNSTDTMGSHSGWSEVQDYSESNRPEYIDSRSGETVSNSGNEATFSIDADGTVVGGAFLVSDNTIGGTSGTLLAVAAFTGGDKTADSGDTINVQYDFSMSG